MASIFFTVIVNLLKPSWNKKDLSDVTAAPFLVGFFFAAGSWEKDTEKGAAVTSLTSFLFCDDFVPYVSYFMEFLAMGPKKLKNQLI